MRRDQHDRRRTRICRQTLGYIKTVEIRESNVKQYEVRAELLNRPQCGGTIFGLADDLEAFTPKGLGQRLGNRRGRRR